MKILVLNGPNLNLLGQREPEIYGTLTLDEINRQLAFFGEELNARRANAERIELYFYQSNHEGILLDTIQNAQHTYAGIIYNPAAHTHYSVALRDAIASVPTPVVEVHLSDISAREGFRALSVMTDACIGQFKGRGVDSYKDALEALISYLESPVFLSTSDIFDSFDSFGIDDIDGANEFFAGDNLFDLGDTSGASDISDISSTPDVSGASDVSSTPDVSSTSNTETDGLFESFESFDSADLSSLISDFRLDINADTDKRVATRSEQDG
ncbi:MAG: 3-dehydroquinate dehydratase [Coriobacteriales bacterium]|jgi:3-dehydroquinate dehydratase-2|nr:3-dehydroquinate dehydratase [Coriobacteriales bacterium]